MLYDANYDRELVEERQMCKDERYSCELFGIRQSLQSHSGDLTVFVYS